MCVGGAVSASSIAKRLAVLSSSVTYSSFSGVIVLHRSFCISFLPLGHTVWNVPRFGAHVMTMSTQKISSTSTTAPRDGSMEAAVVLCIFLAPTGLHGLLCGVFVLVSFKCVGE